MGGGWTARFLPDRSFSSSLHQNGAARVLESRDEDPNVVDCAQWEHCGSQYDSSLQILGCPEDDFDLLSINATGKSLGC